MYKLEDFLAAAQKYNASDIHLSTGENPRIRIDGKLHMLGKEGGAITEENALQIMETTLHQDQKERCRKTFQKNGSVDYSYAVTINGSAIRYRVQAYRSMGKLSLAMRRIRYEIPTFQELNLPPIYETVMKNPEQKGIVIVGGETGSGKSSTLAAMIGYLSKRPDKHIITIEDPIEFVFHDSKGLIHQREMGLYFGEMRDAETVHAAIKAAETGHLVLTSLHTATAAWTFSRILNFFKEAEHDAVRLNLSYNLLAIMNQILVPSEQENIGLIPATEVFINVPSVRQYLREEEKESELSDVIKEGHDGMHSFNMSLARLIKEGHIGVTQAKAYSNNPQELEMLIKVSNTG